MNVWNKVFLGIIFVSAIAVLALAAVEFRIRNTGQKQIDTLNQRIADNEERLARILGGTASDPRFGQIQNTLREYLQTRGRAWFGCLVASIDEETLPPALQQVIVQLTLTSPLIPNEAGIANRVAPPDALRGVVYIFAEGTEESTPIPGGGFLGRFHVDSDPVLTRFRSDEGNEYEGWRVRLVTSDHLSEAEIERIFNASRLRWSVYVNPPLDRVAGVFSELTEEEKQMIPAAFLEKFSPRPMPELTDADREDVNAQVLAKWTEIRESMDNPELTNDFAMLLDWLYQHRSDSLRNIEVIKSSIATYAATAERSKVEIDKMENEDIRLEVKRVAAMNVQRDAVKDSLEQYMAEIARMELLMEKLQTLSKGFIEKIEEAQFHEIEN